MENVADIYPLSPAQQGMLFHTLAAPASGVYVVQVSCILKGTLQIDLFEEVWQQLVDRHPVLRTAFLWEGLEAPLQVVRQQVRLPWTHLDWHEMDAEERADRLRAFQDADRIQGFDLARAPLMRLSLVRTGPDRHQFIWTFHHLLSDGWSTALLLKEVFESYRARSQHEPWKPLPRRPYRDFIAWLQMVDSRDAEGFWRGQLQGFDAPTRLPVDRHPGGAPKTEGVHRRREITLPIASATALRAMAQRHRLTLNTIVQGAWALLLHRYSGETDVVFGTTVSGRPSALAGVEFMVGSFLNTLPVRSQALGQEPLLPWLQQLQDRLVALREHEHTPLVDIQRWSPVSGGKALFDTLVVFEKYPVDLFEQVASLDIDNLAFREHSNYPLALLVVPEASLRFIAIYDPHRFSDASIARLLEHLGTLLAAFTVHPTTRLADLSLLSDAERQQVMKWSTSSLVEAPDTCIHHLFEEQAARRPEAVAVVCEDEAVTYGELDRRANALAHRLRARGAGPEVCVALCAERSVGMVAGILGILKAGAAFVPIDPGHPPERIGALLRAAEAPIVVTQRHLTAKLPREGVSLLILEDGEVREDAPASGVHGDHLAYVIFTSGSTGEPKGVMVTHHNLVYSNAARHAYYPEPPSRFLLLSSFGFDSAMAGIFWTLCTGGMLVVPRPQHEQDMAGLGALVARHQVTHTLCLPSLYRVILEQVPVSQLASLQTVIVAGEACAPAVARLHHRLLPECMLYNEYGPTEATVWSTVGVVSADVGERVPIGYPIPGARVFVLDVHGQPAPAGMPGELYIGGPGVARGYLQRQTIPAPCFLPDPFSEVPGARLYRTGDRVCCRTDGALDFLGRVDQQVKIRGYRIEPGEVEAVLMQHPSIRDAVVVAHPAATGERVRDAEVLTAQLAALHPAEADRLLAEVERDDFPSPFSSHSR